MKAILDYHGFTKMIDVPDSWQTYELAIPPPTPNMTNIRIQDLAAANLTAANLTAAGMAKYHYLIFRKVSVKEVDNELIAIFEFCEER